MTPTRPTPTPTTPTRTQTTRTPEALSRCVEPVAADEFLEHYWEREPLHVPRDEPGRFDDLLSRDDVERLVCSGSLRFPAFRIVRAGAQIPTGSYTTDVPWRPTPLSGTADPQRVAALFAEGATIVLQALHHTWTPLARFCRALEIALEEPVQANAYYTPAHSQGFGVHHDTHDVFCLQVWGEKRWLVYEPLLELPLKHQRYARDLGEHGPPLLDLTLGPGDTLYLPRGWLHEALTSDNDSLHITVGVNVYAWIDAVRAAVSELERDVRFRHSLREPLAAEELAEALRERLEHREVLRRRRARLVETRRPVLDGQLAEMRTIGALASDTPVVRRETVLADLVETTLVFEGKRVRFPAHARAALEAAVAAQHPFTVADLPGTLDEESRLVLVRRLIREGFLRRNGGGA